MRDIPCRNETRPIPLIDEEMPIVVIGLKQEITKSSEQHTRSEARGGRLIAIVTKGDVTVKEIPTILLKYGML